MKLEEALVELRKGRKIRHKSWGIRDAAKTNEYDLFYVTVGALLSDEWEVIAPRPRSFAEAMMFVAEGKMVSRDLPNAKWYLRSDGEEVLFMPSGARYCPSIDDILTAEWEIVDDA